MGAIAEAMTSGELCAECGCSLECEAFGIPIMCHDCHSEYQDSCTLPHDEPNGGIMCENSYSKELTF